MIDEALLARLRQRGTRHGYLTLDDLKEFLPIDRMSADEIALVVVHLEEAGLTVEVDDELTGASRRREATSTEAPVIELPGSQSASPQPGGPAQAQGLAPDPHTSAASITQAPPSTRDGWLFVLGAGAIIAVGAFLFYLIAE